MWLAAAGTDLPRVSQADVIEMRWLAERIAETSPSIPELEKLVMKG